MPKQQIVKPLPPSRSIRSGDDASEDDWYQLSKRSDTLFLIELDVSRRPAPLAAAAAAAAGAALHPHAKEFGVYTDFALFCRKHRLFFSTLSRAMHATAVLLCHCRDEEKRCVAGRRA